MLRHRVARPRYGRALRDVDGVAGHVPREQRRAALADRADARVCRPRRGVLQARDAALRRGGRLLRQRVPLCRSSSILRSPRSERRACGLDVAWCGDEVAWCAFRVAWCADEVAWCGSRVAWCADEVAWCDSTVAWCASRVAWCASGVAWCASGVAWCASNVAWCACTVAAPRHRFQGRHGGFSRTASRGVAGTTKSSGARRSVARKNHSREKFKRARLTAVPIAPMNGLASG